MIWTEFDWFKPDWTKLSCDERKKERNEEQKEGGGGAEQVGEKHNAVLEQLLHEAIHSEGRKREENVPSPEQAGGAISNS